MEVQKMAQDTPRKNPSTEKNELHETIMAMHCGPVPEMGVCLGADCPDKNCRVCNAAGFGRGRGFTDENGEKIRTEETWDQYRESMRSRGGYYTKSIVEVYNPVTKKMEYRYVKPG